MKQHLKTAGLFFAILVFFLLTVPANQNEAEDAYDYARMTEQGTWPELFNAHHLLYLPLMRGIFHMGQMLGYSGRALPVLIGFSMICGALSICLFIAVLCRAGVRMRWAGLFACCLLFSYGFWRYSTTAEIYIPAAACSLAVIYGVQRAITRDRFCLGSALLGGIALLLHLATIPAVLLAAPILYFLNGRKNFAVRHLVFTVLIAVAGYGTVLLWHVHPVIFSDSQVVRETVFQPRAWLKGMTAFGQVLLSGNFLFTIPVVAEKLTEWFPYHMLQEERFAGQQASDWIRYAAPLTFGAGCGLLAGSIGLFCIKIRRIREVFPNALTAVVWLAASCGMALWFEPANPEMWILALIPFWLLAARLWTALPETRSSKWLPVVFAGVLLLHNWVGGMDLIQSSESDYCARKGAWVIQEVRPDDLIVTADSHSFVSFLEYQTSVQVLDAKFISSKDLLRAAACCSGKIFVFEDVIHPLPAVLHRAPASVQGLRELADELQPGLRVIHRDELGTVYQWIRQ